MVDLAIPINLAFLAISVFVFSGIQKAVFSGSCYDCCGYCFPYLLVCMTGKSSTLWWHDCSCIIVQCCVNREKGWCLYANEALRLQKLAKCENNQTVTDCIQRGLEEAVSASMKHSTSI